MAKRAITILRGFDAARIAELRGRHEFFWADLKAADAPALDELAQTFGVPELTMESLADFDRGGRIVRKIHVETDHIVFPFWCAENTTPAPSDGGDDLGIFQVKILIHGDFLLTMHERDIDVPAFATEGWIPPGRSERYAVYVALDGITGTLVEALATTEQQIAKLEAELMDTGLHQSPEQRQQIRNLRSRVTTLRLLLGPELSLFERVGEEIELIQALERDPHDYVGRIQDQLAHAVSRADAASDALNNALQVKLNETNYRLTVVATIFLPLTLLVGFFGMNFQWMVDEIGSASAFWILGVGGQLVSLLVILLLIYGPGRQRRSSTTTGI